MQRSAPLPPACCVCAQPSGTVVPSAPCWADSVPPLTRGTPRPWCGTSPRPPAPRPLCVSDSGGRRRGRPASPLSARPVCSGRGPPGGALATSGWTGRRCLEVRGAVIWRRTRPPPGPAAAGADGACADASAVPSSGQVAAWGTESPALCRWWPGAQSHPHCAAESPALCRWRPAPRSHLHRAHLPGLPCVLQPCVSRCRRGGSGSVAPGVGRAPRSRVGWKCSGFASSPSAAGSPGKGPVLGPVLAQ